MNLEAQTATEKLPSPAEADILSLKRSRRVNRLKAFWMGAMSGSGGVLVYETINSLHTKHAEFVVAAPYLALGTSTLALRGVVRAREARQQTRKIHELAPEVDTVRAGENPLSALLSAAGASMPEDGFLYNQRLRINQQPSSSENA